VLYLKENEKVSEQKGKGVLGSQWCMESNFVGILYKKCFYKIEYFLSLSLVLIGYWVRLFIYCIFSYK